MLYQLLFSIIYTLSIYCYNTSITIGKVSIVIPLENTNVVFSLLLGYFVMNEPCDALDIIGTTAILGLCVYRSIILASEEEAHKQLPAETEKFEKL